LISLLILLEDVEHLAGRISARQRPELGALSAAFDLGNCQRAQLATAHTLPSRFSWLERSAQEAAAERRRRRLGFPPRGLLDADRRERAARDERDAETAEEKASPATCARTHGFEVRRRIAVRAR
jgi:hypothetical protein